MTEEIIIDGVDVSGCNCFIEKMDFPNNLEGGYYNQNNLCECGVQGVESYPFFCKDNPNCYYKQLKRKEQECQKLLDDVLIVEDQLKDYTGHYNRQCEELDKLRTIITEIKEITEECYYKCNSMNNCNISCKYYNNCNGEFSYLLACLNKQINECEVENEHNG